MLSLVSLLLTLSLQAQDYSGLRFRSIGPALTSGRVTSFAVHPANRSHYYVGVASGGVWKTTNSGVTFTPVFENEGAYSIGHVTLDPRNPNTVWVGTGENNSQRSVSYGDGVYRSDDAGRTWRNLGLKNSEHIGRIAIDPTDSNHVFVAAQGPLWGPGGDRGLYRSTDGGATWNKSIDISEHTGFTDVAFSPHRPKTILAASWQRRRHVYTLVNGGPESAIYKSTDGGKTWNKVRGLPNKDTGRIGISFSPAQPCLVYARIEIADNQGGIYRSTDCGESWEKRSTYNGQGMYYGQIIADPVNPNRIYLGDVFAKLSDDGGTTLRNVGDRAKHIDTHTFWIDPKDNNFLLTGCDGGVYESFDLAATWQFKANLPTMQFYDVAVDNSSPYNVYGGTQDNWSVGGPSRTLTAHGIRNSDWFVTNGGDGFQSRIDPTDPNIVYATSQYGGLIRFDKRTGERTGIQPVEGKGVPPYRWNWDSPIFISPHSPSRLYFAANILFRSDDRGNSWRAVSPDLTRQLDRNALPVMGRIWPADSVAKNQSTSFYGNITALSESPRKEGLIYAGTDDGLIQITENAGAAWRRIDTFPAIPERTFVTRLLASQHDDTTVYAVFNNHKNADFKPYILRSADRGATWASISSNLPATEPFWAIAEDHTDPNLLFAGGEHGVYFTNNGGQSWTRLKGNLPTIAVRDIAIQSRENDLILATFGRGFYILDDYSPLRAKPDADTLFPVKNTSIFIEAQPLGGRDKSWQGESFFTAANPPFGAVFTYYLHDTYRTAKEQRNEAERNLLKEKKDAPYPTRDQLRAESAEEPPAILLTVSDPSGRLIRRIAGPATKGFHRIAWDLRLPPTAIADTNPQPGPFVIPGPYQVAIAKRINGIVTPIGAPRKFQVDGPASLKQQHDFLISVQKLHRAVTAATRQVADARTRLAAILKALDNSAADYKLRDEAARIDRALKSAQEALTGDRSLAERYENLPPSLQARVNNIRDNYRMYLGAPHATDLDSFKIALDELTAQQKNIRQAIDADLRKLDAALEAAVVPL
ncbi:MAG: glycosyl hydrolase [Bryobacterales bacterium]|nr:glycosyl hydrolase [Bryobacterales bacterium]